MIRWVLGIGYSVVGTGYSVLDIGYCVLRTGYRVLGIAYWVLGIAYWVLGKGYWVKGTGYWVKGTGFRIRDLKFRNWLTIIPQYSIPQYPNTPIPQYSIPQYPNTPIPQYSIPQYSIPQYPNTPIPQYSIPQYSIPQYPILKTPTPPHPHTPILITLLLFLTLPASAQTVPGGNTITKVGTTSAQFLKIGVGAKAIAMGGTFVAQANDLSALYWNPAGLALMPGSAVQFAQTRYLADVDYSFAGFGTHLGNAGAVAASLIFLDSGEMQVRTEEQPEGTGERFDVQNFAIQLSYAQALTDRFSVGTTVKYIQESIWHSSASAIAFDIGVLFTTPYENLRLGANMANFGPKMQMSGRDILFSTDPNVNQEGNVEIVNAELLLDEHPLPLIFKIGLAWDAISFADHTLVLVTDASHPNDNSEYINVGGEYSFRDLIALRAGYRNLFEEDGEKGLTFGAGLNVRLDRALRIQFDYAYADFGRLEETHWLSVALAF